MQVFNSSFLNVGSSASHCASSKPSATGCWRWLLFPGFTHLTASGHSGVCSRVCLLIQQFLPLQKSRRLPVYGSIKFLFLEKKKSHTHQVLWHWACGGHATDSGFARTKCLLFLFLPRLVLPLFFLSLCRFLRNIFSLSSFFFSALPSLSSLTHRDKHS